MAIRRRVLVLVLAAAFPCAAWAQAFPTRPVELVVHRGAGGGADQFARAVAEIITREKLLAQPLVVANKGGGGGAIAFSYVAAKRGDPYMLLALPSTVFLTARHRSGLDTRYLAERLPDITQFTHDAGLARKQ